MSTVMRNWQVKKEEDGMFHIIHYVGGEEGIYIYDTCSSNTEASAMTRYLNDEEKLSYAWIEQGEGEYTLDVFETNPE